MMEGEGRRIFKSSRKLLVILSLLGLILSYYSVHISTAKKLNPEYKALCDISEQISCSNVLSSSYSKGFGIVGQLLGNDSPLYVSNGVYGMGFYVLSVVLCLYPAKFLGRLHLILSLGSVVMSAYLAYILFYVLHDTCLLCISTYIINIFTLFFSFRSYRAIKSISQFESENILANPKASKKRV